MKTVLCVVAVIIAVVPFPFFANVALAADENGSASPRLDSVEAPRFQVGDWWEAKTSAGRIYRRTIMKAKGTRFTLAVEGKEFEMDAWNAVSRPIPGGGWITFSPAIEQFQFPLFPGKEWSSDYSYKLWDGPSGRGTATGKVTGWETVAIPAGTFHGLRVEHSAQWKSDDGRGPWTASVVCWYVPELRAPAKCNPGSGDVAAFGHAATK